MDPVGAQSEQSQFLIRPAGWDQQPLPVGAGFGWGRVSFPHRGQCLGLDWGGVHFFSVAGS